MQDRKVIVTFHFNGFVMEEAGENEDRQSESVFSRRGGKTTVIWAMKKHPFFKKRLPG